MGFIHFCLEYVTCKNLSEIFLTMEQQHQEYEKWHGSLNMAIAVPIEKAWDIASDFSGLSKWMPAIESCYMVEGDGQSAGCVRFVIGTDLNRDDDQKSWAKERLIHFDAENYTYTYTLEDGNIGLNGYVSTFHLERGSDGSTVVNWSFCMNPLEESVKDIVVEATISHLAKALHGLEASAFQHEPRNLDYDTR